MAQKLFVKVIQPDGTSTMKAVFVLRSWQESDGRQLYLHANGVYGYKDGSPVREVKEFDIIGVRGQRKLALAWWERTGKDLSAGYYRRLQEAEEARQMEGLPAVEGESSDLDAVMYTRTPVKSKGKKAVSGPATWPDFGFAARPDWWGFADSITIAGHFYEVVKVEPDEGETSKDGTHKSEVGSQKSETF